MFISTVNRSILVYNMKDWKLERSLKTLHASTAMDVIADRVLVYGLGDDGFGFVFFKEDYR